MGQPAEVVNKVHLYDRMMEYGDPSFCQANPPHPREIFTDDSGKNLEGSSAEWNTQAGVLSVSTRKANRNPRRGGRQNGASAESPCGSGTL